MRPRLVPLTLLSVLVYSLVVLIFSVPIDLEVIAIPLVSGDRWTIVLGDIFIVATLVLLFAEIMLAATGASNTNIVNHWLSFLVWVIAASGFLFIPGCGNSTFLTIMLMMAFDFVAGFSISAMTPRRHVQIQNHN